MNTGEIMTSEELRKLDAWIAEHVFDWHKIECDSVNHSICSVCGNCYGAKYKHYYPMWNTPDSGSVPFYHKDPAAALEVLKDILARKVLHLDMYYTGSKEEKGDWRVQCNVGKGIIDEGAPTLELAICLLAKQLYQEKVNNE